MAILSTFNRFSSSLVYGVLNIFNDSKSRIITFSKQSLCFYYEYNQVEKLQYYKKQAAKKALFRSYVNSWVCSYLRCFYIIWKSYIAIMCCITAISTFLCTRLASWNFSAISIIIEIMVIKKIYSYLISSNQCHIF